MKVLHCFVYLLSPDASIKPVIVFCPVQTSNCVLSFSFLSSWSVIMG